MVHFVDSYVPPKYKLCCTQKWVTPNFEKDVSPLDDIFVSDHNILYTSVEDYVDCPKCLQIIRKTE